CRVDGLLRTRLAEKGERQVNVLPRNRPALEAFGPCVQGSGGLRRRPCCEKEPHSGGRCFRVKAASACSIESGDLPSCAAISSISRRLRFCDSFQRVSMRVTEISKLTMPSSIIVTYFSGSLSNSGSHCGSMAATSLRCDSCFAFRSAFIFGKPYACTAA